MNQNFAYGLKYEYFNPHPKGIITKDCVKRAIVVATDMSYEEVQTFLNKNKKIKSRPFNDSKNYNHCIKLLGGIKINMNVPKGTKRWHITTINKIMQDYPKIKYILRVSKHLIGIKNNTIYDLFDDRIRDKGIYNMYLFNATEEQVKEIQDRCSKGDRICQ